MKRPSLFQPQMENVQLPASVIPVPRDSDSVGHHQNNALDHDHNAPVVEVGNAGSHEHNHDGSGPGRAEPVPIKAVFSLVPHPLGTTGSRTGAGTAAGASASRIPGNSNVSATRPGPGTAATPRPPTPRPSGNIQSASASTSVIHLTRRPDDRPLNKTDAGRRRS